MEQKLGMMMLGLLVRAVVFMVVGGVVVVVVVVVPPTAHSRAQYAAPYQCIQQ
jgi:hypothetical protein